MRRLRLRTVLTGTSVLALIAAARADVLKMPEGLRSLETVRIDQPGNAPDDNGLG
jgi:hypothetical protein